MFWSVILAVIEIVNSARRNEFTLINVMHKSNCGVFMKNNFLIASSFLWKRIFIHFKFQRQRAKTYVLRSRTENKTDTFLTRDQYDCCLKQSFETRSTNRSIFLTKRASNVKNCCVRTSFCCSKTLLNRICFSGYTLQIMKMKKIIQRFQFSLTIIWERNRESIFSWRKNIKRSHLNVPYKSNSFRLIKFPSSQVSENRSSTATNRHFDRSVNSLFCSQPVSLQLQQASDASPASTDNCWAFNTPETTQTKSPVHPTSSASGEKSSAL